MIFELEESGVQTARMKVVGVGGGGGNAVNRMIEDQLGGRRVHLGQHRRAGARDVQVGHQDPDRPKLTRGLGAGARPEIGRQAIEENRDEVAAGGAGRRHGLRHLRHGRRHRHRRGAGRAQMARETGALTVGIVTKPFLFEGRRRMKQAEQRHRRDAQERGHDDRGARTSGCSPWSARGSRSRTRSRRPTKCCSTPRRASPA